jgi:hypothetical protein
MNESFNKETQEWEWNELVRHLSFDDFANYMIKYWVV